MCFLCGSSFAVCAVCELCLLREVASLPRTQRRRPDDVCVFWLHLFVFPFCLSILRSVRRSAHRLQPHYYYYYCCSHVYAENDDDGCMARVEAKIPVRTGAQSARAAGLRVVLVRSRM
ncbi:hypothetical protein TcCL_NonESM11236, partial [Trypanosoma cruzi]